MLLNSNDLFEQIGLIAESNHRSNTSEQLHPYSVFLEIQLSQGQNQLIEIKHYDNPHLIATDFCRKHKLNSLAVEIVENKIKEAKRKEEQFIRNTTISRKKSISSPKEHTPRSANKEKDEDENKTMRVAMRGKVAEQKSIERSKSRYLNRSPTRPTQAKAVTQQNDPREISVVPKTKKPNPHIGDQLYNRARLKNRMLQNQRQKQKKQKEQEQLKELTFHPKINPISAKIMQFRKQNPVDAKQKQNKKLLMNASKATNQQELMKQCTFKPEINRVSNLIATNGQAYKDQFDHFNTLYREAENKKNRLNAQIQKSQVNLFQPSINPRSMEVVKDTFEDRLQKSLLQKKKKEASSELDNNQYSFKPKIGRAPKDSHHSRVMDSSKSGIWNQLHQEKLKKSQTIAALYQDHLCQPAQVSEVSNNYYEHLVDKRCTEVFEVLDSDQDGHISPEAIAIENLTKNQLLFLRPIFEEMDQLGAELDELGFKKAIVNLMKDSDPSSRGSFLFDKPKNQQKQAFRPLINQKSKQMVLSRVPTSNSVYDQLYEQGLKEMQKKQYRLQLQKARQQEKQLQQCSFKPHLRNTSKYYIDKVLGKQIHARFDDQRIIF